MGLCTTRVEQSTVEVGRLATSFDQWLVSRRADDRLGSYRTQLASLGAFVEPLLAAIRCDAAAVATDGPIGEVYDACRHIDKRTAFVRRLWTYFRERFDQRLGDGPEARLLRAADELAWSCWAEPHRRARPHADPPPLPLPYLFSASVPEATLRRVVPYELRPPDAVLAPHVQDLPIPTVGLPHACVDHPWTLALLAHEVGHHVQHEVDGGALLTSFADLLATDGLPDTWAPRHEEVFADVFGVLALGPATAWMLQDLLTAPAPAMREPDADYPAAVERLELAWALLHHGGVDPDRSTREELAALGADPTAGSAPTVARLAMEAPLVDGHPLPVLVGWESARGAGVLDGPAARLAAGEPPAPDTTARGARRAIATGVAAWRRAVVGADPDTDLRRLADDVVASVAACRPPGTRAATTAPPADLADRAARLTEELRRHDLPDPEPGWR